MNYEKIIAWATVILVVALTIISLVLTYNALYEVAFDNGLTKWKLAYLWPLTIDFAIIVFSLAVVNASLSNDSTKSRWWMVGVFTVLTILFNFVDGGTERLPEQVSLALPFIVRVVPPVALVLSFETLMSMLRKAVKRDTMTKSLNELSQEKDKMTKQIVTLERQKDKLNITIDKLNDNINDKKMSTRDKRLSQIPDLMSQGLSVDDIAKKFKVQPRQIYRDLKDLGINNDSS